MSRPSLGIRRIHSFDICVHDAKPWINYFTKGFGFHLAAATWGDALEATGTREHLLRCRDVALTVSEPVHAGSRVRRYLRLHPEGIGRLRFLVDDAKATEERLIERNATPTDGIVVQPIEGGMEWRESRIATPLGEVEFCFVEIGGGRGNDAASMALLPGMKPVDGVDAKKNRLGIQAIDHLTANVRTIMPVAAFLEHVLGFTRFWGVQFHTEDLRPGVGTGLRCVVMQDEASGIKIAVNEPLRPRFHQAQPQLAVDANRGPGILHLAFAVGDIIKAYDAGEQGDIVFLNTPSAYYEALPGRIATQGITGVTQTVADLRTRGILLDGDKSGYLLQAFCRDRANPGIGDQAGPLFFELIQRCGATGFGEGNFRALLEAMEQA